MEHVSSVPCMKIHSFSFITMEAFTENTQLVTVTYDMTIPKEMVKEDLIV